MCPNCAGPETIRSAYLAARDQRRASPCESSHETAALCYGIICNLNKRSRNTTAERLAVGVRVAAPIDEVLTVGRDSLL